MAIKKTITKNKTKCKVTFSLPAQAAPEAKEVKVVGDFNNWDWNKGITLNKKSKEFQGQLELEPGQRYEFRYLIDNERWDNDWQADEYVASPYGVENSVVITPNPSQAKVQRDTKMKANKAPMAKAKNVIGTTSTKKSTAKGSAKTTKKNSKIDFTVIEGVGPKICQILESAGYKNFAALSTAKVGDLRKVLQASGPRYKVHDPSKWARQAKMAANNQWSKLNEYQAVLKEAKK